MKKLFKTVLASFLACSLIFSFGSVSASTPLDQDLFNSQSAQNTIYQYVNSIDNKDWNTYVSLQLDQYQDDLESYLSNDSNTSSEGILTVNSAEIKEIKTLPIKALNDIVDISDYTNTYGDIYGFLVGTNYTVDNESKYYMNGVNYSVIIVGQIDGKSKILFEMDAPLEY
jgi:hypothetical protein